MSSKVIELRMSNVTVEPFDLVHQVSGLAGTVWENPYSASRNIPEEVHNYRMFKNYFTNLLFLEDKKTVDNYNELLERAKKDGLLVFECTCEVICHLDALREKLTEDLDRLGFTVTTNRKPYEKKVPEEVGEE